MPAASMSPRATWPAPTRRSPRRSSASEKSRRSPMRLFVLSALFVLWVLPAHAADGIVVDKDKKTVTVDAKIAPRKLDDPKFEGKIYPIEVIACWAYPKA